MTKLSRAVIIGAVSFLGLVSVGTLHAQEAAKPAAEAVNPSIWTTDFDAALKEAATSKRLVLVDFTGSDWCGWCIKLDEEVFDKAEFKAAAPKDFVLVKLDFPQKKKLPAGEKERNDALQKKYVVQGFPTILMLDGSGKVLGKTGYRDGGPVPYLSHLKELAERPALLAKAKEAKGADKARQLAAILAQLDPSEAIETYPEEVDAIIANDPDNALGLKAKYVAAKAKNKLGESLQEHYMKKDFAGMIAVVESYIKEHKPEGEELAELLFHKVRINLIAADFDKAEAAVAEIVKAAPDSRYAKMAPQTVENAKKRAEAAKKKAADKAVVPEAK